MDLSSIALRRATRGLVVGKTGSGKTTLEQALIRDWLHHQPQPRILVLDSKPCLMAEWELHSRMSTKMSRRYAQWDHGTFMPDAVVLPGRNPEAELKAAFKRYPVAIAQAKRPTERAWLLDYLEAFYATARARYSQLAVIDELSHFFGSNAAYGKNDPVTGIFTSGRELGMGILACTQRPLGVPGPALTEVSQFYLFRVQRARDWKHLQADGIPLEVLPPPPGTHEFTYYDAETEQSGRYLYNAKASAAA